MGRVGAEDTEALLRCVHTHYLPTKVLMVVDDGGAEGQSSFLHSQLPVLAHMERVEGKATAYVCKDYTCAAPVTTGQALHQLLAL